MRALILLPTLLPGAALAEGLPTPAMPAYSADAEFWFAMASVAMILSLAAAGWLVSRR